MYSSTYVGRKSWIGGLLAMLLMALSPVMAQEIKQGRDYEVLDKALAVSAGNKVEVFEFFSYGCPHCFHFEPELKAWEKANASKVSVMRSPVIFPGTRWGEAFFAEIYYTLEAMGQLGALHEAVFEAVQNKGMNFGDDKILNGWLSERKINPTQFAETRKSFGVQAKINDAKKRMNEGGVDSTPQLIVAGKYRILPASSFKRMLEVADLLIYRESQTKKR